MVAVQTFSIMKKKPRFRGANSSFQIMQETQSIDFDLSGLPDRDEHGLMRPHFHQPS